MCFLLYYRVVKPLADDSLSDNRSKITKTQIKPPQNKLSNSKSLLIIIYSSLVTSLVVRDANAIVFSQFFKEKLQRSI